MDRRTQITRRLGFDQLRIEHLLPLACLVSAAALFASELMTTFEFVTPAGEAVGAQDGIERHGLAMAVIGVFGFGATLIALLRTSKPAATAVAIAGLIALLVFLVVDLPNAGAVGTLEEETRAFFDAEAAPRIGFWLALTGALGLTVSGTALATLSTDQLAGLRPRRPGADASGGDDAAAGRGRAAAEASGNSHGRSENVARLPRTEAAEQQPSSRRERRRRERT